MDLADCIRENWFLELYSLAATLADADRRGNHILSKRLFLLIEQKVAILSSEVEENDSNKLQAIKAFLIQDALRSAKSLENSLH